MNIEEISVGCIVETVNDGDVEVFGVYPPHTIVGISSVDPNGWRMPFDIDDVVSIKHKKR